MKRILAFILSVIMILTLAACSDKPELPIGGNPDTADTAGNGTTPAETEPEETEEPEEEVYTPEPSCPYIGTVGVGTEAGTAAFDDLTVRSKSTGTKRLLDLDLEELDLSVFKGNVDVFAGIEDTVKDGNHAIENSAAGFIYTGNTEWNYYQYSVKARPTSDDAIVSIYFCVIDENNYYVLNLGEEGNTKANVYQVKDGERSEVAFAVNYKLEADKWTSVGVTLYQDTIEVYIAGNLRYALYDPDFRNQYYDYTPGDIVPASVSECEYGAPAEGVEYLVISEENVIHDGKGRRGTSAASLPPVVFDNDISTYYYCDEYQEYELRDDELIGIYGDGTFETGYVGAYFENGVYLTAVRYCPLASYESLMTNGIFQVSLDGEEWIDVHTVEETPMANDFVTFYLSDEDAATAYKYVRFVGAVDSCTITTEIEFWGKLAG